MNKKINYPNGDCYEGEVNEQGLPHGNGVMVYCGDCENDLPYGKGKLTNYSSVTDMTYDGEWKDGLRHGFGEYTLSWDKGTFPPQRYEGEWKDDKRCGKGICWYGRNKDKMYEGY